MNTRTLAAAAALLALAACTAKDRRDEAAAAPPVLAGVPVVPNARLQESVGTPDAARLTFVVDLPVDSVAAFYRRELVKGGWRLVSDVPDSAGTDLLAQRAGPPLWVQIRPGTRPGSTRFALIGAVGGRSPAPDSARGDSVR